MSSTEVTEGTIPFDHESLPKPCFTWYKIWGDLKSSSTGRPLLCLHGGPGMCHNYMLPMQQLAYEHGITVLMYDQLGCGNSTRLRDKRLDTSFWTPELFITELENLLEFLGIDEYDLLGQSWGGMLGSQFAIRHPTGLKNLVISNSPASMELWIKSCNEWRAQLPQEVETVLQKYEDLKDYDNQEYIDAVMFWNHQHLCRVPGENGAPFPQPLMETFEAVEDDNTVYFTMNGPSEFTVIGSLKTWSVIDQVYQIQVPTLILNGEYDEARSICVKPFADSIPNNTWKTIEGTSHCSHIEKTDLYCEIVAKFLKQKD